MDWRNLLIRNSLSLCKEHNRWQCCTDTVRIPSTHRWQCCTDTVRIPSTHRWQCCTDTVRIPSTHRWHCCTDTARIPPTQKTVVTKRPVFTANIPLIHSQRKTEAMKWVSIMITPCPQQERISLWTIRWLLFSTSEQIKISQHKTKRLGWKNYTERGECKYLKFLISEGSLQEGQGGGSASFKDNDRILRLFRVITD